MVSRNNIDPWHFFLSDLVSLLCTVVYIVQYIYIMWLVSVCCLGAVLWFRKRKHTRMKSVQFYNDHPCSCFKMELYYIYYKYLTLYNKLTCWFNNNNNKIKSNQNPKHTTRIACLYIPPVLRAYTYHPYCVLIHTNHIAYLLYNLFINFYELRKYEIHHNIFFNGHVIFFFFCLHLHPHCKPVALKPCIWQTLDYISHFPCFC